MTRDLDKLILMYRTDPTKLDALLEAITRYACAVATRHDHTDPEDVAQEVSIACWKKLGEFDVSKGSFRGWVATITLNFMRKQAALLKNRLTEYPEHLPEPEGSDVEMTSYSLQWANDEEKQLLFHLSLTLDFSETAKFFNLSPKALRSRLERIKVKRNPPPPVIPATTNQSA